MTGYAVCEMHYEYDDNYYNASGGYNPPTKIFKSKEKALEYARERILSWFMDVDLNSHFHSIDSLINREGYHLMRQSGPVIQIHAELEPLPETYESFDAIPGGFEKYFQAYISAMTSEQFHEFYEKHLEASPFSVVDVIVED